MNEVNENKNNTYNVLPGTKMGILAIDYLEKLTELARKHAIPFFKITRNWARWKDRKNRWVYIISRPVQE